NDASLASGKIVFYAVNADDSSPLAKIWPLNVPHKLLDIHVRLIKQGNTGPQYLNEVMWRNIGGEANSDATRWIDNRWNPAWQVIRLQHSRVLFIARMLGNSVTLHIG